MKRRTVGIGLLGTVLDRGRGPERWESWRPTVALGQQEDLLFDRFELLFSRKFAKLAQTVAADFASVSPETEVHLREVAFQDAWDFEEVYGELHDYARGYPFRPETEDYLVHITTGTHVAQICLFLLTESRHLPARLIQTSPPDRHRRRSPGDYAIVDLDLSKYDRLASRFAREQSDARSVLKSGIETRNQAFNRLIERIEFVAMHTVDPILLTGPTGAGKSQLARRVFELKKGRHQITGTFVEVNCATIRGDAAMSALFGHVKGAFTGALKDRPGLLRMADGGLLFLDEVGELGQDEQAMLLRALEEKRFLPLGGDSEVGSDFQLIAGTNRDLAAAVREGRFREDLLARMNLWTFALPGLRDRAEDVAPNLDYELGQFTRRTGRRVTMSREVRERFLKFAAAPTSAWRANFRDLNATITRMATLSPGGRISRETLDEELEHLERQWAAAPRGAPGEPDLLAEVIGAERLNGIDLFDRLQLGAVIRVCQDSPSLSEAGRRLFAVSRARKSRVNDADRLRKYLARFGLSWADAKGSSPPRKAAGEPGAFQPA
ncbi:MAG: sigma 54-interacting transcriptional regulator [Verrucomicrobiales bacterium]|nr:sigma 54-interacting transcriptional regulator [Verrucomicrobiales bacterium]